MAKKRKKPAEASKNHKLNEFLKHLEIEYDKRGKIVAFVEDLTFRQIKQLSTGIAEEKEGDKKKLRLRLRMPWTK